MNQTFIISAMKVKLSPPHFCPKFQQKRIDSVTQNFVGLQNQKSEALGSGSLPMPWKRRSNLFPRSCFIYRWYYCLLHKDKDSTCLLHKDKDSTCPPVFKLIQFWLCWVFIAACQPSLVAVSAGYSLVVVHRLLIVVASLLQGTRSTVRRLQQLRHMGSVVVRRGISRPMA